MIKSLEKLTFFKIITLVPTISCRADNANSFLGTTTISMEKQMHKRNFTIRIEGCWGIKTKGRFVTLLT